MVMKSGAMWNGSLIRWCPPGAGMLFGESDTGKTFTALHLAVHISADLPWLGHRVAPGTVVFIEAEGGRSFALRKHAAKAEAGVTPNLLQPFPFVTVYEPLGFGPDTDPALVQMRAAAIRDAVDTRHLPPIRLVVVDTLAQNMHGDVDSNAEMGAFLTVFRAFLKALSDEPVFGLLIHHPGHTNKDRARGAYALPADLDLIMRLEGTPDELTLSCDRMRDAGRFAAIGLKLDARSVVVTDRTVAYTLVVVPRTDAAKAPDVNTGVVEQIVKHLVSTRDKRRRRSRPT